MLFVNTIFFLNIFYKNELQKSNDINSELDVKIFFFFFFFFFVNIYLI